MPTSWKIVHTFSGQLNTRFPSSTEKKLSIKSTSNNTNMAVTVINTKTQ